MFIHVSVKNTNWMTLLKLVRQNHKIVTMDDFSISYLSCHFLSRSYFSYNPHPSLKASRQFEYSLTIINEDAMRMSIGRVIWEHIKNMLTSYFDYSKDVAECDDFLSRGDIKASS